MIGLLALHGVLGLGCIAASACLGRRALLVGGVAPLVTLVWLVAQLPSVVDGRVLDEEVSWVPALDLSIALRLDGFALLMALLVAGIGVAVFAYSLSYFEAGSRDVGRLAGLLTLFAGAMLGIVLADDLLLLYTCWELTSVTSYLLIAHEHAEARARAAALHALLVTTAGGLSMLGGFVLLGHQAGTYRLSEILDAPPGGTATSVALVLVLLGVTTKSAQYPFHGWLPGAMAAPTPVSTYLHSATMVKAGIYLLARLAPVFAVLGFWRPLLGVIGLVTMVGGGLRALRQHDLKLLLAFSTVSQLGFLTVMLGVGTPAAVAAGCVLLLAHGLAKAALFMVVGTIDRTTGTRDLRHLPPLGRGWGPVTATAVVACASLAGVPLALGFVAKEASYASFVDGGVAGGGLFVAGLVVGSALTVGYCGRFLWGAFLHPRRRGGAEPSGPPSTAFVAPGALLALGTILLGVIPGALDGLVGAATRSLAQAPASTHLAVWHGWNLPLALSALTLVLGGLIIVVRPRLGRLLAVGDRIPSGADVYLGLLRGLNALANRVTGVVQNGSLPVYAGVILLTASVLPAVTLLSTGRWPGWPRVVETPAHVAVAVVVVGSALAAATNRRRLSAVLLLGMVGYGMAALFVVQGAPDLALTQVAIETLSTVLFVLVLRRLPAQFEKRASRQRRVLRLAIAGTVGASVFAFALFAADSRTARPISDAMVEQALPDGNGRNVVNVILVDFRGLDTLLEITVLAAAAIGAVALARVGRRAATQPTAAFEREGAP